MNLAIPFLLSKLEFLSSLAISIPQPPTPRSCCLQAAVLCCEIRKEFVFPEAPISIAREQSLDFKGSWIRLTLFQNQELARNSR